MVEQPHKKTNKPVELILAECIDSYLNFTSNEYIDECLPNIIQETINRNKYWMNTILKYSCSGKNSLVACGYLHLQGTGSLIHLFLMEDYSASPWRNKIPEPEDSKAIKEIVEFNRYLHWPNPAAVLDIEIKKLPTYQEANVTEQENTSISVIRLRH